MLITISGMAGSGKSTVAKQLALKLHAEHIYVGGMRRELAKQKGMTLTQLNEYAKTHPETDVDVDKKVVLLAKQLEKEGKIVVVEGRPQYHFLPTSIKIYMKVNVKEAARRVLEDLKDVKKNKERNEGVKKTLKDVEKELVQRDENDALRYLKYYGIDHRIESQYDLVVDTTKRTSQEALKVILDFIQQNKKAYK